MDWSSLPLNFMSMGIFLIALKIQKGFNNKKKKKQSNNHLWWEGQNQDLSYMDSDFSEN